MPEVGEASGDAPVLVAGLVEVQLEEYLADVTLQIIDHFIQTLDAGDTNCARTPIFIEPATGQFPRLTAELRHRWCS